MAESKDTENTILPLLPITPSLVFDLKISYRTAEQCIAPENEIPACYDDSLAVMKWVSQKSDSSGANIAHNMMMRASIDEDHKLEVGDSLNLVGMTLIHPYFEENKPDRIWSYICPENPNTDDPRCNLAAHPSLLSKLCCSNILICIAEKDFIRDRGWTYYEALKKCGWKGEVEIK
uniref:Alpha/beta hydrolase fold-3 domain-containing protein n=1 Tax=Solanum lycopersicum TaxID=4081 RepID=A0A3Q7GJG2_SOLLC